MVFFDSSLLLRFTFFRSSNHAQSHPQHGIHSDSLMDRKGPFQAFCYGVICVFIHPLISSFCPLQFTPRFLLFPFLSKPSYSHSSMAYWFFSLMHPLAPFFSSPTYDEPSYLFLSFFPLPIKASSCLLLTLDYGCFPARLRWLFNLFMEIPT